MKGMGRGKNRTTGLSNEKVKRNTYIYLEARIIECYAFKMSLAQDIDFFSIHFSQVFQDFEFHGHIGIAFSAFNMAIICLKYNSKTNKILKKLIN